MENMTETRKTLTKEQMEKIKEKVWKMVPEDVKQVYIYNYDEDKETEHHRSIKYFNTETYEIVYKEEEPGEPYVEVDDNIAWVVAELNRKGYRTLFSCEGHYEGISPNTEEQVCESAEKDYSSFLIDYPYITFAPGVRLPSVPDKWFWQPCPPTFDLDCNPVPKRSEGTIYADINEARVKDEGQFTIVKLRRLTSLIKWVKSLGPAEEM